MRVQYQFFGCLLGLLWLGCIQAQDTTKADIFATVWNLPESHVSVTQMGPDGKPMDESAIVIVHEQGKAGECLHHDNAADPLLTVTDESIFEDATFKTQIALFDNYTAVEQRPEVSFEDANHNHWVEVEAFLDAVFETKPMQVAIKHIQSELKPGITLEQIRDDVKVMWFEPYTNRYRGASEFCVGFEHVFVGEDESDPDAGDPCKDTVAGYHSWVKFYLDKKQGKVDCLGYDYPGGIVEDAIADPKVTTLVMRWSPTKEEGSHGNDLLKKPGGFFVGTRPELEMAFGTLAMYAQHAGKYNNIRNKENHHRVRLGENLVDIVMHPQSLKPPQRGVPRDRGWHIRTLYPKFRGKTVQEETASVDLPTQPQNSAAIKIVSALVNPEGPVDRGEWVEIRNTTEDTVFDLANWSLTDRSGRKRQLDGKLEPGATLRIELGRENESSMMLRNGGGWIMLFQGEFRRAAVKYGRARESEILKFE
jgi:poly(U)-specific endoribonuclease